MPKRIPPIVAFAGVTLALGLAVTPIASGFGEDDASADEQLQQLTVEIKTLGVADKANVATQELGKAEALRDKARTLVGDKKQGQSLTWTLDELEATVALVDAKIDKHDASQLLETQKGALSEKKKEVDAVTSEVATLQAKREELEKTLAGGK